YFPHVNTPFAVGVGRLLDALGCSRAHLCVSIVTPCHDPRINIADSCKAYLLSIPHCAMPALAHTRVSWLQFYAMMAPTWAPKLALHDMLLA
ncbi:hypothetical protein SLA2020_150540, partial [Shorea laevis]